MKGTKSSTTMLVMVAASTVALLLVAGGCHGFNLPFDLAMPNLHQLYKPLIDYNQHGAFKFLRCMGPKFAHLCSGPILDCLHHHQKPIECIEHLACCQANLKMTKLCIHHLKSDSVYDKLFQVPVQQQEEGKHVARR